LRRVGVIPPTGIGTPHKSVFELNPDRFENYPALGYGVKLAFSFCLLTSERALSAWLRLEGHLREPIGLPKSAD
jgi:hypothetical protein